MGDEREVGDWIFSAKPDSTSLSPDRRTVCSFDLEGRPVSWFADGAAFKRSLGSDVFGRRHEGGRKRYWQLSTSEAAERFAALRDIAARAPLETVDRILRGRLDRIVAWTPDRLLAERDRFDAAYTPVTILPPDQYLAIVLQATFGCSWGRCTFCSFYDDRPFRARSASEFREHVDRVRDLLGDGARLRRRIFLADGNALILDDHRLAALFDTARRAYPNRPIGGFVDLFTGERRDASGWAALRERGLDYVCLGLETGHDTLLEWLGKPGSAADAVPFVHSLKQAGLRVAVIFMVGVGGTRFAGEHLRGTLQLASRLPLEEGDIVYLSPFRESEGSEYARRARDEGVTPLDDVAMAAQYGRLRDGIRGALPGIRVTRYEIREFVY